MVLLVWGYNGRNLLVVGWRKSVLFRSLVPDLSDRHDRLGPSAARGLAQHDTGGRLAAYLHFHDLCAAGEHGPALVRHSPGHAVPDSVVEEYVGLYAGRCSLLCDKRRRAHCLGATGFYGPLALSAALAYILCAPVHVALSENAGVVHGGA